MTSAVVPQPDHRRRFVLGAALAIVEQQRVDLVPEVRRRIDELAARLLKATPGLSSTAAFGGLVAPGHGPWPSAVIEDHSAIALLREAADRLYHYRGLLLAGEGDLLLIGDARDRAFEAYCREMLGLGRVEVLRPCPLVGRPLAARCAEDPRLVARLAARARRAGGLNLVPYMGIGHVWRLAAAIAAAAGRPVRVAAPPPRLTRCVNDKNWFAERVIELLGQRAAPPGTAVHSLSGLVAETTRLARRHAAIAVKLVDAAGSLGNLVLMAESLRDRSARRVRDHLLCQLGALGWRGAFPLQVTAWEQPVLASPSVQLWIPPAVDGPPLVEGVFDQQLSGPAGTFSGAAPSRLGAARQRALAKEAVQLASLFQALGYYGRCSFDAILVGEAEPDAAQHWIECNGRWGGVSIPMTLANRLLGDWTAMEPVMLERRGLEGRAQTTGTLLSRLGDALFDVRRRRHGLVILAPGWLAEGSGFDAMLLEPPAHSGDGTAAAAERLLRAIGAPPTP